MKKAKKEAQQRDLPLRVMFHDEARFGRINQPRRCWAPAGIRPTVIKQTVREYTYAYGAVSPVDGVFDFLILPSMTGEAMNLFLDEVAQRHQKELILMIYDRAPCHNKSVLKIPPNIMTEVLPPYCPQLNPAENVWEEVREKFFPNLSFDDMTALETQLIEALVYLENHPKEVQSIVGFQWIVSDL